VPTGLGEGKVWRMTTPPEENQLDLLKQTDWDVLIIFDACRADTFLDVTYTDARIVRSPAVSMVDREIEKRGFSIELVNIWEKHWSRFTRLAVPSVHPFSVNGVVLAYLELGLLKRRKVVIHYLQPHSPFIGSIPLALGRWGKEKSAFEKACCQLLRPDVAVRRGAITWEHVRKAYAANLALVWRAAQMICGQFEGKVIITSDHGEMLGEDGGKFGHCAHWRYPQLYEVPWLEWKGGATEGESDVEDKLRALGYA